MRHKDTLNGSHEATRDDDAQSAWDDLVESYVESMSWQPLVPDIPIADLLGLQLPTNIFAVDAAMSASVFEQVAPHLEPLIDTVWLQRLFASIINHRQTAVEWLKQPFALYGTDEALSTYPRRLAIDAAVITAALLRALLLMRWRAALPEPGRLVAANPHLTRGPNTRRSICINRSPAGSVHA
ncbi:hypothetical protein BJY24_002787 [Nocardia transvalensis]|uniref:Uncharacterized protein n=1 Tax=Nocardia transvalensis TaxID=37333 RepID=A0A7W9UIN1_9NOCA|nr:hypothetical protein [Nocardia transvalensis]MBB5913920.1 hypothetical protein [Nocardia transvalensis]